MTFVSFRFFCQKSSAKIQGLDDWLGAVVLDLNRKVNVTHLRFQKKGVTPAKQGGSTIDASWQVMIFFFVGKRGLEALECFLSGWWFHPKYGVFKPKFLTGDLPIWLHSFSPKVLGGYRHHHVFSSLNQMTKFHGVKPPSSTCNS